MKKKKFQSIIKCSFLALCIFAVSVIISVITRALLMFDITIVHFSEGQSLLIAGIIEGVVAALSAGLLVYQLKSGESVQESKKDIEEAGFILKYNQAFIQDSNMAFVEQTLEQEMLRIENNETPSETFITDENRQIFINYLVYLEGLAPLVFRNILKLNHIDDLMAYRFFLAMNTPALQNDQLKKFPDYYKGCFKLYDKWKRYRKDNNLPIINEKYSIDLWEEYEKYIGRNDITIGKANNSADFDKIAELIYKTDPYIYPAAFGNMRKAKIQIAELIKRNNNPYGKDNIYIVKSEDTVVGISVVLTQKADYNFENDCLSKNYNDVAKKYFNKLNDYIDDKEIYISCVCVDKKFRCKHIGEQLLMQIIRENQNKNISLHVLKKNKYAIILYKRCGFIELEKEEDGYSKKRNKPKCIKMTRFSK